MQIKKQTDQAIRILVHLSSRRQTMVGKELARLVGASEKYLPYIMQQLRKAGLVSSFSGTSGGYALAKNAKEITLLDVMVATADEPQISCYTADERDGSDFGISDELLKSYDLVHEIVMKYFKSLTIWDLSRPERLKEFYSKVEKINNVFDTNKQALGGDGI